MLGSRQQGERVDVSWADDVEVPTIECGDARDVETFGNGDDGGIDQAESEIGVSLDELGSPAQVSTGYRLEDDLTRSQPTEERRFRLWTTGPLDHLADLDHNGCRDDEGDDGPLQQVQTFSMMTIAGVEDRNQRSGVDKNH